MEIIQIEKFEYFNINNKIELKYWQDFVDLAEKWFDDISNEWVKDKDKIVFFDGRFYFMISRNNIFYIKAERKNEKT